MATIPKRTWITPSGEVRTAFVIRYYDNEGKYRSKQFKRERDAKEFAAKTAVEVKQGVHRPDSTSVTIREAGQLWLDRCKSDALERSTMVMYEIECRRHI